MSDFFFLLMTKYKNKLLEILQEWRNLIKHHGSIYITGLSKTPHKQPQCDN